MTGTELQRPLGKKDFVPDSRDILWEDLRASLKSAGLLPTTIPAKFGHGNTFTDWRMLANGPDPTAPGPAQNGVGCCVWSSAANETKIALTDSGAATPAQADGLFNGATTVSDYAETGYNVKTGAHDDGTEIRQALSYRQKTGIVDTTGKRHKIGDYVLLEPGNPEHMLEALYFFEGIPIGLVVTQAQMDQFNKGEAEGKPPVWTHVAGSAELGGHCIPEVGVPGISSYIAAVTWRLKIYITKSLIKEQVDEAWAYSTPERISAVTGKSYEGANPEQLEEYLHLVGKAAQLSA